MDHKKVTPRRCRELYGRIFQRQKNETDYTIDRYAEKILLLYSVKSLPQEETIEEFLQKK